MPTKKKYRVYNQLFRNGKPVSPKYENGVYASASYAKKVTMKDNRTWNNLKSSKKDKLTARLVQIKQIKSRKKR